MRKTTFGLVCNPKFFIYFISYVWWFTIKLTDKHTPTDRKGKIKRERATRDRERNTQRARKTDRQLQNYGQYRDKEWDWERQTEKKNDKKQSDRHIIQEMYTESVKRERE